MADRKRAAVTRIIPEDGMALLRDAEARGEIELRVWEGDLPPNPAELDQFLDGVDGVLTLLTERVTSDLLDRHPAIRVISNIAVGFDNIDIAACTARGVVACNTPGVLTETTADFTWALLMSAARRIVEGADYVRDGKWQTWSPTLLLGWDVHHATIGIVGFGRIGKEVAKRARGFDMTILATDEFQDEEVARELGVRFVDLDTLLRESDFVSLHCALTPETRHLIGVRELELMKPTGVLVNAARGPVVDTDALHRALVDGEIAAAALDVTDPEPLPADHPLIGLPNCLVVPHIASATVATRNLMATMSANNLLTALRGERPPHPINPEVLDRA